MEGNALKTWPKNLIGGEAYPKLMRALESNEFSDSDYHSIMEVLSPVGDSVIVEAFYPALDLLLVLLERQPMNQRRLTLVDLARPILFAVEQEHFSCRDEFASPFSEALKRARKIYCDALCDDNQPGIDTSDDDSNESAIESLLLGLSACARCPRAANAIRDIDC